jgi:two-component system, NarL family, response regulator NreC
MSIRILIVDDHRILRAGLKTLLNPDSNIEVVGEATCGEQAIQLTQEIKPEIVLMDIGMPGIDALEVVRTITQTIPETRVLMLTMHEDSALVQEYIRAGASGYIIKRAAESELIDAIYAVWRGIIYIHPSLMQSFLASQPKNNAATHGKDELLTPREIEVLSMIVRGHTNRQIASALSLSVRTVETHRSNVTDKLNLRSRVDLVRYAVEHGLVKIDDLA